MTDESDIENKQSSYWLEKQNEYEKESGKCLKENEKSSEATANLKVDEKKPSDPNIYEWIVDYKKIRSGWQFSEMFIILSLPYRFKLGGVIGINGLRADLKIYPAADKIRAPGLNQNIKSKLSGFIFEVYVEGKNGRVYSKSLSVDKMSTVDYHYAIYYWNPFLLTYIWSRWKINDKLHIFFKIKRKENSNTVASD